METTGTSDARLLLLLVSLSSLVLASAHLHPDDVPAPIKAICAKTSNANLCHHVLHPYLPLAPANPDAAWALEMDLRAIKKHTDHVVGVATGRARAVHINEIVAMALNNCIGEHYSNALSNLDTAGKRLATRDKDGLNIELSAVLTNVGTCDDEFVEIPGSPVAMYNEKLRALTSLALELSDQVWK